MLREIFYFTPMDFVAIRRYDNYIPAHIDMGRLKEEGIECWLKDENTVTIDPILSNAIGGIKLMAPEEDAKRAWGILKELELDHKSMIACPQCGSHNIELITTPRKASNWLSVIAGFLSLGYAMPVDTVRHCFQCGHEFPVDKENEAPANDLTDN